uniref:SAM domain-containing protein n=2 Tax=Caenorhabditis japonica TaxID=281687 RepID=A0A8R1DZ76_CAEJA
MDAWKQFFVRAGIPNEIAQRYAKSFHTNRITKEMLPDLDKSTLAELGVTAIGDQLSILRRIKAAKSALERIGDEMEDEEDSEVQKLPTKPSASRSRITAPEVFASTASELRRGKPPPDRNEIYHVKMPVGNTHRTRQILQKAEKMRQQGLAVRGTTGVRQGGRSVSPVDKSSLAARMQRKQSSEVSSTTTIDRHGDRRHLHGHGHGHGSAKISRIATSSIKKTIINRPSLTSRLTVAPSGSSQSIRVHMEESATRRQASRIEGRLQKTSGARSGRRGNVVLEYAEPDEYEEVMEDDQMMYEEVVTMPMRHRVSYSGSGRPSQSATSAPISSRIQYSDSSRRQNSSGQSVHSRVTFRR